MLGNSVFVLSMLLASFMTGWPNAFGSWFDANSFHMGAELGSMFSAAMLSVWRPRGFRLSISGMGRALRWWTVDLIAAVIAAFISGGTSVQVMPWCRATCWAKSSALTIHSSFWSTTSVARRFVIPSVAVSYDALRVVRPLSVPLLWEVKQNDASPAPLIMYLSDIMVFSRAHVTRLFQSVRVFSGLPLFLPCFCNAKTLSFLR